MAETTTATVVIGLDGDYAWRYADDVLERALRATAVDGRLPPPPEPHPRPGLYHLTLRVDPDTLELHDHEYRRLL